MITNEASSGKRQRKYWIDCIRGIAMLLVILGHQCPEWNLYFVLTSAIKVTMFFVISGYLFNDVKGDSILFFKKLFFNYIIPYFFLSLFPFKLVYAIIRGSELKNLFFSFFNGTALWYMPCCIFAEAIHFFIRKYTKGKTWAVYSLSVLFMALGLYLGRKGLLTFGFFNTALTAEGFMAIGYLIKNRETELTSHIKTVVPVSVLLYGLLCVVSLRYYPGEAINIKYNYYYDYGISLTMIFIGSFMAFFSIKYMDMVKPIKKNNPLVYIGQNTLVFYMLHRQVILRFNNLLSHAGIKLQNTPFSWLVNTLAGVAICWCISYILTKYCPFVVGRRKAANRA